MVMVAGPAWEAGCAQQSLMWQPRDWICPILIAESTAERMCRLVWQLLWCSPPSRRGRQFSR